MSMIFVVLAQVLLEGQHIRVEAAEEEAPVGLEPGTLVISCEPSVLNVSG